MKTYKTIKLSNGAESIVSESDFELLSKWKWRKNKQGYAVRNTSDKQITIHAQLMGSKPPLEIDHINRNKLDNRRENLRFVTRSQNNLNRNLDPRNKVGHNGISKCKTGSYRVRVSLKELGRYKTLEEAIAVRNKAVNESF